MIKYKLSKVGRKPRPKLTIAVDCGALSPKDKQQQAGVATVTRNLLTELSRIDKRNTYLLYSYSKLEEKITSQFGKRCKNIVLWPALGYKTFRLTWSLKWRKPDVFLALAQAMPSISTPTLGFVYDLAYLKYPQLYPNYQRLKTNTDFLVDNCQHLVTISESTKKDILDEYKLSIKQITVCYPGVAKKFRLKGLKYLAELPYFLYVGTLKPTKNIPFIIRSFAKFIAVQNKKYQLILLGGDQHLDPEISKTIQKLELQKFVVQTGYVADTELPKYYRGAVSLVSPAIYEGFGLPLLEAMACGTPVIAAKNASMPEVVGKGGILINNLQQKELITAFRQMADIRKRAIYANRALKQARKFSTRQFARKVLDIVYKINLKHSNF